MNVSNKTTFFPSRVILTGHERLVLWNGNQAVVVLMDGMAIPTAIQILSKRYENIRWTESKVFSRGPYTSEENLEGSVRTADGVSLTGLVKIEWLVRDTSDAILKFLRYQDRELNVLTKQVVTVLQETLINQSYDKFFAARHSLAKIIEEALKEKKWAQLRAIDPQQIYLIELDAADASVREAMASHLRLKREENYRIAEAESLTLQAQADEKHRIAVAEITLKIEKLQAEQAIYIEKQKALAHLEIQTQRATLLATEAGQMAEDLQAMLAYKRGIKESEERILVLQKSIEEYRLKIGAGYQAGQIQVLTQVAPKTYRYDLDANPLIDGGEGVDDEPAQ